MIAAILLSGAAIYLGVGFLFAFPFVFIGAGRIDPHARHGSWGFRLLIFPGSILLWPLLAKRWFSGAQEPPVEKTAHRAS